MKKPKRLLNGRPALCLLLLLPLLSQLCAQNCSTSAATAKYWQYRERLYKHFMVTDRDTSGCINDGIGQDSIDPCKCSKNGFSLPATSIEQSPNGARFLKDTKRHNIDHPNDTFVDLDCAEDGIQDSTHQDVSWGYQTHNYLEMGSETPTQLGWYLTAMAMEYELLRKNGQQEAQQRVLEDIFLALQAHRRLDIMAQCIVKRQYDELKADSLNPDRRLCTSIYPNNHCGGIVSINGAYDPTCNFTPQTDGYSGFFIREDATQGLEAILNDTTEDKYNIDLVGSTHSMSLIPPCKKKISQACYLASLQHFMSQDQVIGLYTGLAFIKRYIPATDSVTTCDGRRFPVLSEAQKIAKSLYSRIDEEDDKIAWPGTDSCATTKQFLSNCEGGNLNWSKFGLRRAKNFICDENDGPNFNSRMRWGLWGSQVRNTNNKNANMFLLLTTLGMDVGPTSNNYQWGQYGEPCEKFNKQLYPVLNNLLFPAQPNVTTQQDYLKDMLCSAPCEGPCRKTFGHDTNAANPTFECANIPNWLGERWDGHGKDATINGAEGTPYSRLFNGLDYMVLHNAYRLQYEQNPVFYDPTSPENNVGPLGGDRIEGPGRLCPGETGTYRALAAYTGSTLQNFQWTSSNNLTLSAPTAVQTNATMSVSQNAAFIQVSLVENRLLNQYYYGKTSATGASSSPTPGGDSLTVVYGNFREQCESTYRKSISNEPPAVTIESHIDPCDVSVVTAIGDVADNTTFTWTITETNSLFTRTSNERSFAFTSFWPGQCGDLIVELVASNDCGTVRASVRLDCNCSSGSDYDGRSITVVPNPANDVIAVNISNNGTLVSNSDWGAVNIKITPINSTTQVLTTDMNSNGQTVYIGNLPNGVYRLTGTASNWQQPTGTVFVIARD